MKRYFATIAFVIAAIPAAGAAERIVLPKTVVPTAYDVAIVPNAAAKTFTGQVAIAVHVNQATNDVVLNAANLDFKSEALSGRREAPQVSFDTKNQTATLHFGKPIAPGDYTLTIRYDGKINDSAAGFFLLDYDTVAGKKRALFTQFENSDARRFLPCWDEPGIKSVFKLTATLPAGEMAVSNMPVASEQVLPAGLKKVRFQTSPKMSSYLLFYGQGDFERVSRKVGNVDIGVIVKRGDTGKAAYPLESAAEILAYYNDYFGTPYPLPKLDLIAGPGRSEFFGAMENWGAIFFFERTLLVDPKVTSEGQKRGRWETIAHEMAHQWFGDLVTMDWWDDLWLNEGFATWMEMKAADKLHAPWKVSLDSVRFREFVMGTDARRGTHPIVQPIVDVLQAGEAFDDITYVKGALVIRMLEDYLGEDAFRAGVRAYMKKHAYGNTVTDDLWVELENSSGQPVKNIAHDFTLQPGVPQIKVAKTVAGLELTQERFAYDDSGATKLAWRIPVTIKGIGGELIWRGVVAAAPVAVPVPPKTTAIVNAGQAAYFRTSYDNALFAGLSANYARLSPSDQLGVLGDATAMATAGLRPPADALALTAQATPAMEPQVQQAIADQIDRGLDLEKDLPGEARMRAFGKSVLSPLFAEIGWTAKPGEAANGGLLRNSLIRTLGATIADPETISEVNKRFATFLADRSSLSPNLRPALLNIVAVNADAATWETLHQLARSTTDSMEKNEFYGLLGVARDKAIAAKALDLALTEEVPASLRPGLVGEVAGEHPDLAFDFALAHMSVFEPLLEPTSRSQFYLRLPASSHDSAMLDKLDAFAAAHVPETARMNLVKVKAEIAQTIKLRREAAPLIDTWLKAKCSTAKDAVVCRP